VGTISKPSKSNISNCLGCG